MITLRLIAWEREPEGRTCVDILETEAATERAARQTLRYHYRKHHSPADRARYEVEFERPLDLGRF